MASVSPDLAYLKSLKDLLGRAGSKKILYKTIVSAPFHDKYQATQLDLGLIVLTQVSPKTRLINRLAVSDTEFANGALMMSKKSFMSVRSPLDDTHNAAARALQNNQPIRVTDWYHLFTPVLSKTESRLIQEGAGIELSYVYPLKPPFAGTIHYSYFHPGARLAKRHHDFMNTYTEIVSEALLKER